MTSTQSFLTNSKEKSLMVDILHRVGIKSSLDDVYKALATREGLAAWTSSRDDLIPTLCRISTIRDFSLLFVRKDCVLVMANARLEPAPVPRRRRHSGHGSSHG